jgi:hypothetical protein
MRVMSRREAMLQLPLVALPAALGAAAAVGLRAPAGDANGDVLATISLAYRYALPIYEISRLRYQLEIDPARAWHLRPNHLSHKRKLASPDSRLITAPNADTLYSLAMVDLAGGPVRIDVPDTAGRYYSVALIDAYTNDFAYIGRRTTGTQAGSYLVVGPGFVGAAADDLPVIRAPTRDVVMLVRILVYGPDDLAAVHRLQDGFKLTPLGVPPPRSPPIAPVDDSGEIFVAVVNRALGDDPPPAADAPVLARIETVGVGPRAEPLTPALRRAWDDDFAQVRASLAAIAKSGGTAAGDCGRCRIINGWSYPPPDAGQFGTSYGRRAVVALAGLFANRREENMSVRAVADADGRPLDSRHRYRLHLPAQMPVDAFWSLSVYAVEPDGRQFFANNPLHRYAIGDRTPGLRRKADGSLEILIQHDPPDAASMPNWLPIPDGPFHLSLRNYQPHAELLDGRFHYPAIQRVD